MKINEYELDVFNAFPKLFGLVVKAIIVREQD